MIHEIKYKIEIDNFKPQKVQQSEGSSVSYKKLLIYIFIIFHIFQIICRSK